MDVKVKSRIQEIIYNNTTDLMSEFSTPEMEIDGFIVDMEKSFIISSQSNKSAEDVIYDVFKKSQKRVTGTFRTKELNKSKFIKELSLNLKIESK